VCAVQLACTCRHIGELDVEAPLIQLLHYCSTALLADVAAAPLEPAAVASVAAASNAAAAPALADPGCCAAAAGEQPGMTSAAMSGGTDGAQRERQQPVGHISCAADSKQQLPPPTSGQSQLEWQSVWAPLVAMALDVRSNLQ
jgi:hypothetical protein